MVPIRIYFSPIPSSVHGLVFPGFDSESGEQYTIILNEKYSIEDIFDSLMHELYHIWNNDFDVIDDVDRIEHNAHSFKHAAYRGYPPDFLQDVYPVLCQEIRRCDWHDLQEGNTA